MHNNIISYIFSEFFHLLISLLKLIYFICNYNNFSNRNLLDKDFIIIE